MKAAKKTAGAGTGAATTGLVANGASGTWRIDLDESLSGSQRWFVQIEGPSCYLNFEVSQPQAIADMAEFLGSLHDGDQSPGNQPELKLGKCGRHTVELLWDRKPADRCFVMVRSDDQFCVRVTLFDSDVQALLDSLEQVCEELREGGLFEHRIE